MNMTTFRAYERGFYSFRLFLLFRVLNQAVSSCEHTVIPPLFNYGVTISEYTTVSQTSYILTM